MQKLFKQFHPCPLPSFLDLILQALDLCRSSLTNSVVYCLFLLLTEKKPQLFPCFVQVV